MKRGELFIERRRRALDRLSAFWRAAGAACIVCALPCGTVAVTTDRTPEEFLKRVRDFSGWSTPETVDYFNDHDLRSILQPY